MGPVRPGIADGKGLPAKKPYKDNNHLCRGPARGAGADPGTYKAQSPLPLDTAAGSYCNLLEL